MDDSLSRQVDRYIRSRHKKRYRTQLIRCLALLVAFATIYALIMPAITLSNEVVCGKEAHVHSESCYEMELASPRPELVCGAGGNGELLIHSHDAFCYDERGELICALPEREAHTHTQACCQESRSLVCGELQELGHTHSGACYAYDKGELVCGQEEGQGGHVHSDACYPTERVEEPVCGREEDENHTHDESCFTVVVRQRLKCGQEECDPVLDEEGNVIQEGHTHSAGCWMTDEELRVCGQREGQGHTHTQECYSWTERLVCAEEEREPGHIHTGECYAVSEVLACQLQELAAHTHGEGCYDEAGELVCGLPEVGVHQHTQDCLSTPEGGPEEVKTLVCGLEEHIHTDACYVELAPSENDKYYCGLEEHLHDSSCYFDSGALWCTLTEHAHTAECLDPETAGKPVPPKEPVEPGPAGVELDESYEYVSNELVITFRIEGFAPLADQGGEPGGTEDPAGSGTDNPDPAPPGDGGEPDPTLPESGGTDNPGLADGPSGVEPAAEPATEPAGQPAQEPLEGSGGAEPSEGSDLSPAETDPVSQPGGDVQPAAPSGVVFQVTEPEAGSPEYERVAASMQELEEDQWPLMIKLLSLSAATVDGQELDLSQCRITAEARPTEELLEVLEESAAAGAVMTIDEPDDPSGEAGEGNDYTLTIAGVDGEVMGASLLSEGAVYASLRSTTFTARLSAEQADPKFTVEYYAYLETADLSGTSTVAGKPQPEVIDTPNGTLPTNKMDLPIKYLELTEDKTIKATERVQPIYRTHKFNYLSAPGIQYFNIVTNNLQNGEDGKPTLPNYELAEVWLPIGEGETADTAHGWSEVAKENLPQGETGRWQKLTWNNSLRFTNRAETAEANPDYILIEDDDLIRLVYKTKAGSKNYPSNFYDYDISDGKRYSDAGRTVEDPNGTYLKTGMQGINNSDNYQGTGSELAFGNNNTGTGLGDKQLGSYYINRANANTVFRQCSFGLVSGMNGSNGLTYHSGIDAPNLFGGGIMPEGRTDYSGSLQFLRDGDTYTLTSAAVAGTTSASELHKLKYERDNWNKTVHMYSNDFWPMDHVASAGTEGHDPLFGSKKYTLSNNQADPESDYGGDHNAYFGMRYAVEFTLTDDYIGPLEYIFFGDDDMWVFLTDLETGKTKLICDIGGVHQSVGEYVDLWDHVGGKKTDVVDATLTDPGFNAKSTRYRLTFFYTERGASGSTCWMQFTLPTAVGVELEDIIKTKVDEDHGALWIEKKLEGLESSQTFRFTLDLKDPEGKGLGDNFKLETFKRKHTGETETGELTPVPDSGNGGVIYDGKIFELAADEVMAIMGLPAGTAYTITEVSEYSQGFHASHETTVETVRRDENGQLVTETSEPKAETGAVATGTVAGSTVVSVVYTNHSDYELPETGGAGLTYTVACVPLMAAGILWYKKRSHGEGAEDRA